MLQHCIITVLLFCLSYIILSQYGKWIHSIRVQYQLRMDYTLSIWIVLSLQQKLRRKCRNTCSCSATAEQIMRVAKSGRYWLQRDCFRQGTGFKDYTSYFCDDLIQIMHGRLAQAVSRSDRRLSLCVTSLDTMICDVKIVRVIGPIWNCLTFNQNIRYIRG